MPTDYIPVLLFLGVTFTLSVVAVGLPHIPFINPLRPNKAKSEVVESGKLAYGDAKRKIPIQYYTTAMLFILFDIEVLFFYPWAVVFWELRWYGIMAMSVFTLLLVIGFAYEWRKGAMEWD
ncbi:NADH-quinone oxidoreductase subunit A [Anaerolineales bacterium HSG6]|nr:NADH-quinone oxidoreductase subunit A [Anaerolineales bacterium HSG6]MDM8530107.1 NADH-quinone oxidoreductase subunit A [Anaerolineales bacterium HSG25]